jgi:hypothetical protein
LHHPTQIHAQFLLDADWAGTGTMRMECDFVIIPVAGTAKQFCFAHAFDSLLRARFPGGRFFGLRYIPAFVGDAGFAGGEPPRMAKR